jgi:cytoskeletal protein CcmA (bactofilin family)
MDNNTNTQNSDSLESLEEEATTVTESPDSPSTSDEPKPPKKKKSIGSTMSMLASRVNIYLLAFILLVVISLIIVFVVMQSNNAQVAKESEIKTQELTQEAIDSLTGNEATVGDPKQLLNVESNAVFAGKVLIRDGLDVAGPIKVGGDLSLPGITVSGRSAFDEVTINSLSIAGDTSVQGRLTVQQGITVNGQASFGGPVSAPSITIDSLSINGDVQFNRHLDAGGATPSVSGGSAVGSGGTVTVSGTDTAGTVTINKGSGGGNGILATVTFASAFNGNPHVVFSPVTSSADLAAGNYFLSNRTTSGFSISVGALPATGSISFDYIVID